MPSARLLLIIALTLGATIPAGAADKNQQFSAKSVATLNCRHYLDTRRQGGEGYTLYGGFLGGYVTAYNQYKPEVFDLTPWENVETLAKLLTNYCLKNPDSNFGAALKGLVTALGPRQLEQASEKILAEAGEHSVVIYRETLIRVQQELSAGAHYQGEPLGHWDAATRDALSRYQNDHDLPVTGVPDQGTLYFMYYR